MGLTEPGNPLQLLQSPVLKLRHPLETFLEVEQVKEGTLTGLLNMKYNTLQGMMQCVLWHIPYRDIIEILSN